ncbi:MAG: EamA family transporter [Edaphobacter sp.]|uniref:EamA family transporter n=1 Tax=Edaphobacter sp. TaxID=1934404 RepID=UPI00239795BF|nr:EamA family transporter [Edaphobacter sp.]MDE1175590.1 EamA family transporter [Edaphobacter sp.]
MSQSPVPNSYLSAPASSNTRRAFFLGLPAWLFYSLLTILVWGAWGATSKVASDGIDANTNQIFFTLGLLPLMFFVLRSPRIRGGHQRRSGIAWAFFTGLLGGVGNIAFFRALEIGGKASIVVPTTALFPLVTVVLAVIVLHERISTEQWFGLALAFIAIYLLSA